MKERVIASVENVENKVRLGLERTKKFAIKRPLTAYGVGAGGLSLATLGAGLALGEPVLVKIGGACLAAEAITSVPAVIVDFKTSKRK